MSSLCCPSTKPYQDRPNSTPHEAKFVTFLAAYPTLSTKPISPGGEPPQTKFKYIIQVLQDQDNGNTTSNRFFGCQDSASVRSNPVPIIPRPAPKMSAPPAAPSSSLPGSEPSPPYRPRFNMNGTTAKPMKRAENSYGSGWSQQRSSASASWTSGSNHNGFHSSNSGNGNMYPPKRTNSGPPSWVSKDAADSSNSWRSNNSKRPLPSPLSSTSPVSTSPQTPRSPNSFGGRGPFPPKSATNGGFKKPFGGQYLRPPSVARSSTSHTEGDTSSAWDTASTATDTTWNNRFACLGGNEEGNEQDEDGEDTASDNSGGLDSYRFEQAANSLVTQDEDDDFPVMRFPSDLSTNWRRAEPVFNFVEITEREIKKSGMIKDGNFKMWRCIPHNTLFKIYVYVPGTEHGF